MLRVSANDWVEITDDVLELTGQPGVMARIVGPPNDAAGTVVLDRALPAGFNPADPTRHTRLIRWDQQQGVDANGLLPIAAGQVELEDGVFVTLALDTAKPGGTFHVGDWWAFAARTADASVEMLTNARAVRHPAPLLRAGDVHRVRRRGHRHRRLPHAVAAADGQPELIAAAPSASPPTGTIPARRPSPWRWRRCGPKAAGGSASAPACSRCRDRSRSPGSRDVIIAGQGAATALVSTVGGVAVRVDTVFGLRIEDLSVVAISPAATFAPAAAPIGILLRNAVDVTVQRCGVAALAPAAAPASQTHGATSVAGAASLAAIAHPILSLAGHATVTAAGGGSVERRRRPWPDRSPRRRRSGWFRPAWRSGATGS